MSFIWAHVDCVSTHKHMYTLHRCCCFPCWWPSLSQTSIHIYKLCMTSAPVLHCTACVMISPGNFLGLHSPLDDTFRNTVRDKTVKEIISINILSTFYQHLSTLNQITCVGKSCCEPNHRCWIVLRMVYPSPSVIWHWSLPNRAHHRLLQCQVTPARSSSLPSWEASLFAFPECGPDFLLHLGNRRLEEAYV